MRTSHRLALPLAIAGVLASAGVVAAQPAPSTGRTDVRTVVEHPVSGASAAPRIPTSVRLHHYTFPGGARITAI